MTTQIVQIKIDPASVKKNPSAGQTSFFVPGAWHDDGNGCVSRSIQTVYTMSPGKPYLYSYLPTVMGCDNCNTDFFHTQLEDTMDEDGDGNLYGSSTVCPYCHEHVDCELEFEKIDDFLKKFDEEKIKEILSNPVKLDAVSEKEHKEFCDELDKTTRIPAEDWYKRFD